MPAATWQGEHGSSKMTRHDIVCVHTIVGYAPAHAAHFSVATDGHIMQSRDTVYKSAANLDGNYRVIAIETADMPPSWNTGDGHAVPDFTPAQVDAVIAVIQWAAAAHGIPITPCPDSRSSSRGIAYHRQGIDGNFGSYAYPGRVSGGEQWSSSAGKVCPGDRKIATLLGTIIPRAAGGSGPQPPTPPEDDMTPAETDAAIRAYTDPINAQLASLSGQIGGLSSQIGGLSGQIATLSGQAAGNRSSIDAIAVAGVDAVTAGRQYRWDDIAAGIDDQPVIWDGPRRIWSAAPADWDAGRYWEDAAR